MSPYFKCLHAFLIFLFCELMKYWSNMYTCKQITEVSESEPFPQSCVCVTCLSLSLSLSDGSHALGKNTRHLWHKAAVLLPVKISAFPSLSTSPTRTHTHTHTQRECSGSSGTHTCVLLVHHQRCLCKL